MSKQNIKTLSDENIVIYNILNMLVENSHYGKEDIIKKLTSNFEQGAEWQECKKNIEYIWDNYIKV
tara:strand:+ start:714 stop:911 length:198 start_codon:yes stop_codon:yes gene_type:complete